MHVQRSVKSVRRKAVRITLKEFENVSVFSNRTEGEDMVVSQDDHVLYLLPRHCCSFSYSSFLTRTPQC